MNASVKQHHDTFSRFQDSSGKDLTGFVAYCLYKKDKIAWIESREVQNGSRPTHQEIESYFIRPISDAQIQVYRERASDMLNQFADRMLGAELEIEREAIRNDAIVTAVAREISTVKAVVKEEGGFAKGVWQNLVASGIAWVIGAAAIIGAWAYYDVNKLLEYFTHAQEQQLPPPDSK